MSESDNLDNLNNLNNLDGELDINSSLDVNSGLDNVLEPEDLPSLSKTGNKNEGVAGRSYYETNSFTFYSRAKKPTTQGITVSNNVSKPNSSNFYGNSNLTDRLKSYSNTPDAIGTNTKGDSVYVPFAQQSLLGDRSTSNKRTKDINTLFERMTYLKEKLDNFVGTGINVSYKKGGVYGDQILGVSVKIPGSGISNLGKPKSFNFDVTDSGALIETSTGRLITSGVYSTSVVDKRMNAIDVATGLVSSYIWSSTVDSKYSLIDKSFESQRDKLDYSAFNKTFGGLADSLLLGLKSSTDRESVISDFKQRLMNISLSDIDKSLEFNVLSKGLDINTKELARKELAYRSYLKLESAFSNIFDSASDGNVDNLEQKLLTAYQKVNSLLNQNQKQEFTIDGRGYKFQALQGLKQDIISNSPSLIRQYSNSLNKNKKSVTDLLLSPFLMPHDLGYSQGQLYSRTVLAKDVENNTFNILEGFKYSLHNKGAGLHFFDSARHKHGEAVTYAGAYVKGIGETANEGENYASFYSTEKLFKSMSQLGYVSLTELKQQLKEAGVKDPNSILNKYSKNYQDEEEDEPTLVLLPFRKLQQMSQRLKNMLGTRAAVEISADLLDRARNQKSFTSDYYSTNSTDPDEVIYKLRADKFLTGNLPATLPQVQFQELQRVSTQVLSDLNMSKADLAKDPKMKQEYDAKLVAALRQRELSPYQEIRGVIGGKQSRRVLVNIGISTMSDFSYLNKEYLDKSAFAYQHTAKFSLSKSKMTPYGIAENNFLYSKQLEATQRAFNTKEERYIYHGREELKEQGGAADTLNTIKKIFIETSNKYGVETAKKSLIQRFNFLDENSFKISESNKDPNKQTKYVLEAVNLKPGLYGFEDKKFTFFGALNGSQLELAEDYTYVGGIQFDSIDNKKTTRRKQSILSIDVSAESRSQQRGITFITSAPIYTDNGMKTGVEVGLQTSFDLTDGSRFGTPNIKNPVRVVEGDIFNEYDQASKYKDLNYSPSSNMPIFGMFNTSAFKGYNYDAGAELIRSREGLNQIKSYSGESKALSLALAFMDNKDTPLRQTVIDYLKTKASKSQSDSRKYGNLILLLEKGELGAKVGKFDNLMISAPGLAKLSTGQAQSTRELVQGIQSRLQKAFTQNTTGTYSFDEVNTTINSILDNALLDGTEVTTNIDGKSYNLFTFNERSTRVRSSAILADIISTTNQILDPVDTLKLSKNFFEYSLVDKKGKARLDDYVNNKRFRDAVQDIAVKSGFKLPTLDKILSDKKEEEVFSNTLIQLNVFINKPRFVQRAVNILPSYSLTASGTDDAVKLEFQYLMSASKRELANLKGTDVDINEMSAINTAFKIATSYGNLELAMSAGKSINVISPFLSKSSTNYEDQGFVNDFLKFYSPSLDNIKMYGSRQQQSMSDRLIIDYVGAGTQSDTSLEQYKNIVKVASDYIKTESSTTDRLKVASDLISEFSDGSLKTFGFSLDINDEKRQVITNIVSSLVEVNPYNLNSRIQTKAFQKEVLTILQNYKKYNIQLTDIVSAINLLTDDLTGSVSIGDKDKIQEKVFTALYQKDEITIKGFENIKRDSIAESYIGGLNKIVAMSKLLKSSSNLDIKAKAESLYNQAYQTQAVMTVEVDVQEPTPTSPGVISLYDKNQIFSNKPPTSISFGSSAAIVFGLDVLQSIPVEFGNYTHQLLPDQVKLRQLLPEYRAIVSRLTKGYIQNATIEEIKVIQDFNELAVKSQEALAGIGASILQQKVTAHGLRFPGASAIATASYLLGMDEVAAGNRFTGPDSSISKNYVKATDRVNRLKNASKENIRPYGDLKIPKSLQEYDNELYKKFVDGSLVDTDLDKYKGYQKKTTKVLLSKPKNYLDVDLSSYNDKGKVKVRQDLERLAPNMALAYSSFKENQKSIYLHNKNKENRDNLKYNTFFSDLAKDRSIDSKQSIIKATNLLGTKGFYSLVDLEQKISKNSQLIQDKKLQLKKINNPIREIRSSIKDLLEQKKIINDDLSKLNKLKTELGDSLNRFKDRPKIDNKFSRQLKEVDKSLKVSYDKLNNLKQELSSRNLELEDLNKKLDRPAIEEINTELNRLKEDNKKLKTEYKEEAQSLFKPFVSYATDYEGKLKSSVSSVEPYLTSKKLYQAAESNLTSEDVYFSTVDEQGKLYTGFGISDDYLNLAVGTEQAASYKNIKDLNKLIDVEKTIADLSGNYNVFKALENRLETKDLTEPEVYKYNQIINKVKSKEYQAELSKLESVISQDKYRSDLEDTKPTRADKYFSYKTKTLDYINNVNKPSQINKEQLWLERLFNFYEGAARFTGYVERAGSPTGGSIISQLRNIYSIDVLKEREKAENYALTTADGYNNTSLIMSAYSSYSVQGGDWDGDSYSLVKGYDTLLQDVLSSIQDRNKVKTAIKSFESEDRDVGLSVDRQKEYKALIDQQVDLEKEVESKLALVEKQKDRLHGSSLYQQAREGMRRHAASVSGLPLEVLMDNRMFDDAKISNTLEHHRNILGNLAFSDSGEVSSMIRIFSEAYNPDTSTLYKNLENLKEIYGTDIIDNFKLHLTQVDSKRLNTKSEALLAFSNQVQDFYQTKTSLSNLNDFVGSAAGQVLDLKTFEASQNIIGYLGTSLIGEGYNSLIGLLPKAAIARSIATEFGSKTSSLGLDSEEVKTSDMIIYSNQLGENLKSLGRSDLAEEFSNIQKLRANASRASARSNSLTGSLALIQQILRDSLKPKGDGGLLDILERVDKETSNTFVVDYLNTPDEIDNRGINRRIQKLRTFISTEEVQKRLTTKESASLNIFGSIYLLSDYMRFEGKLNKDTMTYDPSKEIETRLSSDDYKEYDIIRQRMTEYKNLVEGITVDTESKTESDYLSNGLLDIAKISGLSNDKEFREKMAYDADFAYRQTVAEMLNVAVVEERLGKYIGLESPKMSDEITYETSKVEAVKQVENIKSVFIRAMAGDSLSSEEIEKQASGLDYIQATQDLLNTDKSYKDSISKILNITEQDINSYKREGYIAPERELVTERQYSESYKQLRNLAYLQQSIHGISAEDLTYLRTNNVAGMEIRNASYSLLDNFDPLLKANSESQRAMLDLLQRGKLDTPESFKMASERYMMSSSQAMIDISNKLRDKYMTREGEINLKSFSNSDLYQAASWIGQFTGTFEGGAYSSKKFTRNDYEDILMASLSKDESGLNLIEKAAYKNAGMAAVGQANSMLGSISEQIKSKQAYIQNNLDSDTDELKYARQQLEVLQAQQLEYSDSVKQYQEAINKRGNLAIQDIGQDYLNKSFTNQPDLIEETRKVLENNRSTLLKSKASTAAGLLVAPIAASMIEGNFTINDRVVQVGYDLTESIFSYQAANAIGKNAKYAEMADRAFSQNRMRTQIMAANSVAMGSLSAISGELLISGAAGIVSDLMPKTSKGGILGGLLNVATEVATTAAAISASRVLGENEYGAYDQDYQDYTQQALLDMASSVYEASEAYFEAMFEDSEVYGETEDQNIDFEVSEEDESEFEQRINLGWIEVSFVDEEGNPLDASVQEEIFENQGSW
jgi:hypothetical protein